MLIQGLQKFSTLDFPENLSCVIFTGGCNFRCPYCHNPEMITPTPDTEFIDPGEIFAFLEQRKGKLDGVVITGGEPTLHKDLPGFIEQIRQLGFMVKLDSNGTNPDMLERLYADKLLDYVAMDLKFPTDQYPTLSQFPDTDKILKSIQLIMDSGVNYEFRSTILPRLHNAEKIEQMGQMIQGAQKWYLQNFRPGATLDFTYRNELPFNRTELQHLLQIASKYAEHCAIRDWRE